MKKLVLIVAAAASFAFAPAYGMGNIEEILKLSETLQAETERAKAAKTPEERESIVKELERLTRRMMELAGMTFCRICGCLCADSASERVRRRGGDVLR